LETYLKGKGIPVQFIATRNYPEAAKMFARGKMDGMFSGSGVAGTMIIKGLAAPLVRPVSKDGHSTYWAVVVAPKGTPPFSGKASYFNGKKVIATALASSGEFYYRSLPGIRKTGSVLLYSANHGAAIDALSKGAADIAIVKNWTWKAMKNQYPNLKAVGKDNGDNPDMTLMVSHKTDLSLATKVKKALLALDADQSPEAQAVRREMGIRGFIPTTKKDFSHNLALLRRAGVTKKFNFEF
jgi:ABC-type phosphate/phosphonate transport system substrate-binding protein